jgi:hypothetical protein
MLDTSASYQPRNQNTATVIYLRNKNIVRKASVAFIFTQEIKRRLSRHLRAAHRDMADEQ